MRKLSKFIPGLVVTACQKQGVLQHKILSEWKEIVGEHLSKISVPLKTHFTYNKQSGGILVIGVTNCGYIMELQMMENVILERLAVYFGYKAIEKIRLQYVSNA